ncbi:LysR family transcriptional regulator [Streptosporangium roseum]|uniref:LysR family transcriptional regulator n=1 Tax=Streptosporangium roseum TaxID=2001 RepID=UPI003331E473
MLDLNLLVALDALLEEGSVAGAAARLNTSAPAMSRTLGRIRRQLNDPVLVRAGRHLVPTPRALELHAAVRDLVRQASALLVPAGDPDPATLARTFNLQASDMLLSALAAPLVLTVGRRAPGVVLRFLPDTLEGTSALREGRVDLEIGVIDHAAPETRVEPLGTGRIVGVAREDHPLVIKGVTLRRFADAKHVGVSRHGRLHGPIDDLLAARGLRRRTVVTVSSHSMALLLARQSDLVCLAPAPADDDLPAALGLRTFEIPLELPEVEVAMAWHPRNDADGGQRWLRDQVREVLRGTRVFTNPPGRTPAGRSGK